MVKPILHSDDRERKFSDDTLEISRSTGISKLSTTTMTEPIRIQKKSASITVIKNRALHRSPNSDYAMMASPSRGGRSLLLLPSLNLLISRAEKRIMGQLQLSHDNERETQCSASSA